MLSSCQRLAVWRTAVLDIPIHVDLEGGRSIDLSTGTLKVRRDACLECSGITHSVTEIAPRGKADLSLSPLYILRGRIDKHLAGACSISDPYMLGLKRD